MGRLRCATMGRLRCAMLHGHTASQPHQEEGPGAPPAARAHSYIPGGLGARHPVPILLPVLEERSATWQHAPSPAPFRHHASQPLALLHLECHAYSHIGSFWANDTLTEVIVGAHTCLMEM